MALNLNTLGPNGLAILNRWANARENDHTALQKRVAQLEAALHRMSTNGSGSTTS